MDYAAAYGAFHEARPKLFAGYSVCNYVADIAELVRQTEAKTMLDYGSGKGYQYLVRRVHEQWGGILPRCYDVGIPQLKERPEGVFDGVICTDVMEHIAETDLDEVLADVLGFAGRFAFFAIACRAAKKTFPDGTNMHLTVRPAKWWRAKLATLERPGLIVRAAYDEAAPAG